jgi:hypothetical protein
LVNITATPNKSGEMLNMTRVNFHPLIKPIITPEKNADKN